MKKTVAVTATMAIQAENVKLISMIVILTLVKMMEHAKIL